MNKEGQQFLNNVLGEVFNIHDIHVYTRINIAFWKLNIIYPYLESLGGLSSRCLSEMGRCWVKAADVWGKVADDRAKAAEVSLAAFEA